MQRCLFTYGRLILVMSMLTVVNVLFQHGSALGVEVFIVAGQSNAQGKGKESRLTPALASQPDVDYWYRIEGGKISGPTAVPLAPVSRSFGPEILIGGTLSDALAGDIAIVKVAYGGTTLASHPRLFDWSPTSSNDLYDFMISKVDEAMSALLADGRLPRLAGMFWMQGESDGKSGSLAGGLPPPPQPATANAYEDNLTEFIAAVRTDSGVPQLPIFVGKIRIGDDPAVVTVPDSDFNTIVGEWDFTPTIQAAQQAVADADPNVYLVETNSFSLRGDFLHFNSAGQIDLGTAFATAYLNTVPEPSTVYLLVIGSLFGGSTAHHVHRNAYCSKGRIG